MIAQRPGILAPACVSNTCARTAAPASHCWAQARARSYARPSPLGQRAVATADCLSPPYKHTATKDWQRRALMQSLCHCSPKAHACVPACMQRKRRGAPKHLHAVPCRSSASPARIIIGALHAHAKLNVCSKLQSSTPMRIPPPFQVGWGSQPCRGCCTLRPARCRSIRGTSWCPQPPLLPTATAGFCASDAAGCSARPSLWSLHASTWLRPWAAQYGRPQPP